MKTAGANTLPRFGPRVALRRLALADLRSFQAYRHDAKLGQYQGWSPMSDPEASAFLAEMNAATPFQPGVWCQIGIADRATNELIGDIGVCVELDGAQAEIGFTLRTQSQGQGIGAEAVSEAIALVFEHTAVERVVGITDTRNAASVCLLERVGMHKVETKTAVFRGESCTEHTFVIARHAGG